MTSAVVGVCKYANSEPFLSLQSESSAAVCFFLNPASFSLCAITKPKKVFTHSVFVVFIDSDLFFLILSYSYLTLPEKQSSSAVTWASPGCHVFLKGCLRGTLQIDSFLFYPLRVPYIVLFSCTSSTTFFTVKCTFIYYYFCRLILMLCCCRFFCFSFFLQPCQLVVISLGSDDNEIKWLQCLCSFEKQMRTYPDFYNSSWNGSFDLAFELPSLSCVVFFLTIQSAFSIFVLMCLY